MSVIEQLFSWMAWLTVLAIGIANLLLVHAVPGILFILLSLVYLPIIKTKRQWHRVSIPFFLKVFLWIVIVWFTLGVSDLGDMID